MRKNWFGAKKSQAGYLTTLNISSRKKRLLALYNYTEIFAVADVGSVKHTHKQCWFLLELSGKEKHSSENEVNIVS